MEVELDLLGIRERGERPHSAKIIIVFMHRQLISLEEGAFQSLSARCGLSFNEVDRNQHFSGPVSEEKDLTCGFVTKSQKASASKGD